MVSETTSRSWPSDPESTARSRLRSVRAAPGVGAAIVAIALAVRQIERRVGTIPFLAIGAFGIHARVLANPPQTR